MKTIDRSTIERFRQHMTAKGRQPSTVESYSRDCETFLDFLSDVGIGVQEVEGATLTEFQSHLKNRGIRDNSVRRSVIGVRQFFRFLQDDLKWDQSPLDESPIPERQEKFSHRVTPENMAGLCSAAVAEFPRLKGYRDLAMLLLLGHEGLKANELIELQWRDFMRAGDGGRLTIRGERARTMTLEAETTEAVSQLRDILKTADQKMIDGPTTPMMLSFKGADGSHAMPGLTRHGVKFALYELGHLAEIKHLNSEDLRHHAMSHKVRLGFTPEMLMNHLGLRTPGKISRHFDEI